MFTFLGGVLWISNVSAATQEEAEFELNFQFTRTKILFSGSVGSKASAHELAEAVRSARPELTVVNNGIHVVDGIDEPDIDALKSVIAEVGVSTHESRFSFDNQKIFVAGVTDSQVSVSILELRIQPLLESREFVSQVCIVPSDELPSVPLLLSTGERRGGGIDLDRQISPEELFEAPGINVLKLGAFLNGTENFDALGGEQFAVASATVDSLFSSSDAGPTFLDDAALKAKALAIVRAESQAAIMSTSSQSSVSTPVSVYGSPYLQLETVRFGRASFLLDSSQAQLLLALSQKLNHPDLTGKDVLLRSTMPSVGSVAFNDWLGRRRAAELKQKLLNIGVTSRSFRTELVPSGQGTDGAVAILVRDADASSSAATSE
ncbi:MAG: hypothetical protein AAF226_05110 [Verrucomicrobiota bacterium]